MEMKPTFWDAFKDPRFLLTMLAIVGTAFVAYYRLGQVEKNQQEAKLEAKEMRARNNERFAALEYQLRQPRYTLEDDEKRMSAFAEIQRRELDRRQAWMDEQNRFRIQMVEFATESRAAITELRGLIDDLKKRE